MTEPDNLVIIQLRELRAEMKADREALSAEIRRLEAEMTKRLDAMHLNGVKALRGFIGIGQWPSAPWRASRTRSRNCAKRSSVLKLRRPETAS